MAAEVPAAAVVAPEVPDLVGVAGRSHGRFAARRPTLSRHAPQRGRQRLGRLC